MVTVAIVNFQGMKYLDKCLLSLEEQTHKELEIIIVDNGSTDGSLQFIKENYPKVKLIENRVNLGFSRANNQAFHIAKGQYLMPLNNDAILSPTYIEQLVAVMEMDHQIGIVTGKILFVKKVGDKNVINSTGHIIQKNRVPIDRGRGEIDEGQYNLRESVFGATAVAPLYRREMLDDIQIDREYFDESFFSYFEDVDLSWRSRLLGWECVYFPQAVAYHYGGGSGLSRNREMEVHLHKNRYLLIIKNSSLKSIITDIAYIMEKEIRNLIRVFLFSPHLIRAYLRIFTLMPAILKKRSEIKRRQKVTEQEMRRWFQ